MSSRKSGLDITRHQEVGLELARIRDRLTVVSAELDSHLRRPRAAAWAQLGSDYEEHTVPTAGRPRTVYRRRDSAKSNGSAKSR